MEDLLPAAAVRQGFLRGRHGIGIYKTNCKNGIFLTEFLCLADCQRRLNSLRSDNAA